MKKVIILVFVGILSFAIGTAGTYLAMPKIAPEMVDSTLARLDSLGLTAPWPAAARPDSAALAAAVLPDSALADADSSDSALVADADLPTGEISIEDSLRRTVSLNDHLKSEQAALTAQVERLTERIEKLEGRQAEVAALAKTLSTVEERQLGSILADLELEVVQMLYEQASGRDRSRLLQNMPPARAAQFVQAMVGRPTAARESESDDASVDAADAARAQDSPTASNL